MTNVQRSSLSLKQWAILFFTSLLFLLPGQVTLPVMDRDEARYAQASRQMIETRDFVDIRFQEQTRYVKPILTYWLQSASTQLLSSDSKQIWTYRLPSLLGALIAIMVTAWLGARMGGSTVGLWAGLFLAASMIVTIEARTAKTDALLLAATVSAQAALYLIWSGVKTSPQKFFWAPFMFWLATAIGLLIKGPIILLVSIATVISLSIWEKNWKWIKNLYPFHGLVLVILTIAPWLVLITLKTNGQFWIDSIGHAFLGKVAKSDDSHGMPPGYHLIVYFACFWPASLLTVLQNAYAIERRKDAVIKFLLCWLWPCFILFELVVTKLPHYTLPLYPAIAILSSFGLVHAKELLAHKLVARLQWLNVLVFTLFTAVVIILPIGLSHYFGHPLSWLHYLGLLAGGFIIVFALNWARATTLKNMIPVLGATAIFYLFTFGVTLPNNFSLWPSYQLSKNAMIKKTCKQKPVALVGYPEPSTVFYLGTKTTLAHPQQAVEQFKQNRVCPIIVIEEKQREQFYTHLKGQNLTVKQVDEITGVNVSKGKKIRLNIYLIKHQ